MLIEAAYLNLDLALLALMYFLVKHWEFERVQMGEEEFVGNPEFSDDY